MPPAYEILLLNTAIPQIQAAQSGDTYVVPRDIAFSAALTLTAGTANGVPYLNASKVLTTGSALTFDGTRFGVNGGLVSDNNLVAQINSPTSSAKFMGFNRNGDYGLLVGYDLSNDYASIRTVFDYPIVFSVFNAEKMRLTSTGLGIGESNPGFKLHVVGTSQLSLSGAGTQQALLLNNNDTTAGTQAVKLGFSSSSVTKASINCAVYGNDYMTFNVGNDTERARITSGGDLLVGTATTYGKFTALNGTSDASQPAGYFQNNKNFAGIAGVRFNSGNVFNDTGHQAFSFDEAATLRFEVRSNGGIANYQANDANLSDRREKTNFAPAKSYLDTICAIPVQTFNYIDQSEDDLGLTLGVVAQDVQAVAPELVSESNWGTEDKPKMRLSIYQTDLQYALMKCIQELKSELDSVKAELAALKGA